VPPRASDGPLLLTGCNFEAAGRRREDPREPALDLPAVRASAKKSEAAAKDHLRQKRVTGGADGGRPPEPPPAAGEVAHVIGRTRTRARSHTHTRSVAHALALRCTRAWLFVGAPD
jgi:hypothetical protein